MKIALWVNSVDTNKSYEVYFEKLRQLSNEFYISVFSNMPEYFNGKSILNSYNLSEDSSDYILFTPNINGNIDLHQINGKVKLIHLLLEDDIDPNRQNKSIESLQNLKKFGIEYVQIWNKRWTKTPPKETFTRPNEFDKIPITPGHYGAFRAFADGTINHFTKDDDHFIICEGDALLMVSPAQVVDKINLAISSIKEYDISYFSFGSRYTLEDNILQSKTREQYGEIHIVNNIIGIQMIMFPQRIREYLIDRFIYATWDGADIFLTNIFVNKFKMGILEEPISSQVSGLSAIEGQHRKFIENN